MQAPDTEEINGKAKEVSWWKINLAAAQVEWRQALGIKWISVNLDVGHLKTLLQDFQRGAYLEAKFINLCYGLILTVTMFELSLNTTLSCN